MTNRRSNPFAFIAVCVALAAGTVTVYWGALSSEFVDYDDNQYVYQNKSLLQGLSLKGAEYAFTTFDCGNWHPLTWISLEVDVTLFGPKPFGFHATNLALHVLNTILVFLVLNRLTSAFCRSAVVAAFFALHPLHVESVAWIAERKDVLSTTFLLLTVLAYLQYVKRLSVAWYLVTMVLLTLGLLSKPMLVTVPILLLLLDVWPLQRVAALQTKAEGSSFKSQSLTWLLIEKVPLACLALIDSVMTMSAQRVGYVTLRDLTFGTRIANAFHAYFWYLKKTFVPTNLIVIYPHPEQDLPWNDVVIGVVTLVAASLCVAWRFNRNRYLFFGWCWFVVALLPVIGLIQVGGQAFADRYVYIPHIGLFMAIVWLFFDLSAQFTYGRVMIVVTSIAAIFACAWLTSIQVSYWKNSTTLWQHAYAVNPDNYITHDHLAGLYYRQQDFERAAVHFEQALSNKRLRSKADAYSAWGWCLAELKRPTEAEEKYRAALKVNRYHATAMRLLVDLLKRQGRDGEAAAVVNEYQSPH